MAEPAGEPDWFMPRDVDRSVDRWIFATIAAAAFGSFNVNGTARDGQLTLIGGILVFVMVLFEKYLASAIIAGLTVAVLGYDNDREDGAPRLTGALVPVEVVSHCQAVVSTSSMRNADAVRVLASTRQ